MGVGFVKLRSGELGFLVVNIVDSQRREGKDLAPVLCGEMVGGAGLAVIGHKGQGRFTIECFEPDGSLLWRNEHLLDRLVACAAHTIRKRYGMSRPVLTWQKLRLTAVVERDRVVVSDTDRDQEREYLVTLLFEGEAVWPPSGAGATMDARVVLPGVD